MPPSPSPTAVELCPEPRAEVPHARAPRAAGAAARLASALTGVAEAGLRLVERALWPREPRPPAGRPEKVGVLRVGMIGDSLAALPAIDAVRRRHPGAELVVLTSPGAEGRPGASELFRDAPAVDRCLVWHAEDVAGIRGRLRLLRRLRAECFDRVYLLPQELTTPAVELRNLLFLRAAGCGHVRGAALSHAGWLPGPLARAHHAGARFDPEWRRLFDLVAQHGAASELAVSDLGRSAPGAAAAEALLAEHGLGDAPLLALGPGQNRELKRWAPERFAAVAGRWIEGGGRVCVLGGAGEQALGASVARAAGPGAVNLCGKLDLAGSAELLRRADALLSNDTGTMHLAAAVGCPTVAIFSGWDRAGSWLPFGTAHRSLRVQVHCSPCFAATCRHRRICLDRIEADGVWRELDGLTGGVCSGTGTARPVPARTWDQGREPALPAPKRPTAVDR